ncbi:MAG: hypothetical protein HY231_05795 [Acidobacteria bacterium]|nr:hypothetical protein [Acidobacteriota bacterium]
MQRRQFLSALAAAPALFMPTMQSAPSWWPFLGEAQLCPIKTSTDFRISYQANGFDMPRKNRIKKTVNRMFERNAEHIIDPFRDFAAQMTVGNFIPLWLDNAYSEIQAKWLSAGSYTLPGAKLNCAEAARRFDPSSLLVTLEAVPFQVPGYAPDFWAVGTTDGRAIRAVCVTADRFFSDPPTASLRLFNALAAWEMGNALALYAGYQAASTSAEVGSRVPGQWSIESASTLVSQ